MYAKSGLVLLATVIALAWLLLTLGCTAADTVATPASTPAPLTTSEEPAASAAAAPLAMAMGGPYTDYGKDIARDAAGNLYVTGYFRGTVDFDPGPGVVTRTAAGNPANIGATDLFLARYTPDGALTWVMSWGGALGADMPHTIRVDGNGDLLLTGYFSGQPDFDPAPTATLTLDAGVGRNLFVAKYTAAGDFLWALGLGDAEANPADLNSAEEGMDVTFDAANNVYLTGVFSGTIDLDPADGNDSGDTFTSAASRDFIVASYSPTGMYRWGCALGGPGQDHGHALRVGADGSVYLGGMFSNAVDFDPGPGVTTLTAAGGWDAFLAQYDASGVFVRAARLGGPGYDQVRPGALELARNGDVLIGGSFANTVDFDPGAGTANLTSAGDGDLFVARYAADGAYRWAFRAGAAGLDFVHRVAVDAADNIYVTGSFLDSVDFDPGPGTATLTAAGAGGASAAFVAKYTAQGAYLWANPLGGAVSGAELLGIGTGLAVDAAGNVAATGRFYGVADLGNGVALTSAGDADIFVVRYDPQGALAPVAPPTEGVLVVDFNDNTAGLLVLRYGPTDAPPGDPAYTVVITNGAAHYLAPAHAPGMRFTGMLDLPDSMTPITGDLTYEWTFPVVSELRALGAPTQTGFALAGCYIRGELYDWVGGLFGDYWFGYAWSAATGPLSVIRQGTSNLTAEPFTATNRVTYRLVKANDTALGLYANYDQSGWHQVGVTVTLVVTPGGSDAVAVTHVRAVDPSGKPVALTADDFSWRGPGVYPPSPYSWQLYLPLVQRQTDDLAACRRSAAELTAGLTLLNAKFAFLLWADQDLTAQQPVLTALEQEIEDLQQDIESSNQPGALAAANRATALMWQLFRETKPLLDARPGDTTNLQTRYALVPPIVADSVALARIKLTNTLATGQDAGDFQASTNAAAALVAQAQQAADQGDYAAAMQTLSQAVPLVDAAIVGLPRNSAGVPGDPP